MGAPTLTLQNQTYPYLRIAMQDGTYEAFQGGQLEISPELEDGSPNPHYEEVKAEAARNPTITVVVNETTCNLCGEQFSGSAGRAQLGNHTKRVHPDVWDAQQQLKFATQQALVAKERAGIVCQDCTPIQEFGSREDLAAHVSLLHTAPPALDDSGNELGRRPGEREIPNADGA